MMKNIMQYLSSFFSSKKRTQMVLFAISCIVLSSLHTLFLNRFFLNYSSLNPKYYITALCRVYPHFSHLSVLSYTVLTLSAIGELILYALFFTVCLKGKLKESIPIYGSAKWATLKTVRDFGFTVGKDMSAIIVGQSNDAVFEKRVANKKEREQIHLSHKDELDDDDLTAQEKANVKRIIKAECKKKGFHTAMCGKKFIGISSADFANVITIGGVGSGKSQSTIIPTLLSWKDSVIVNDPKGELFRATAGWRSKFSSVLYLNPLDLTSTFTLNFLDWIPRDDRAVAFIQQFAEVAIPDNKGDSQPYFNRYAREVFKLLILDTLCYGKEQSVGEAMARLADDKSDSIKNYFTAINDKLNNPGYKINEGTEVFKEQLESNIGFMLKEPEETFTNVISTMRSKLQIFSDPLITTLSNNTTIDPDQFQLTYKPLSIYTTTPTSDVDRCKDFIRLIFSSILLKLTERELPKNERKHKVLFVLDEFFQLGTMNEVYQKIPIARSYGLQFMIAVQSIAQINANYGKDEAKSILENMGIKDIKQVSEPETASWVKSMLGRETITRERKSKSTSAHGSSTSVQSEDIGKELMTESEIIGMSYEDQLTIIKGVPQPYKSKIIHAFEDPRFKDKINLPFKTNKKKAKLFTLSPIEEIKDSSTDNTSGKHITVPIKKQNVRFKKEGKKDNRQTIEEQLLSEFENNGQLPLPLGLELMSNMGSLDTLPTQNNKETPDNNKKYTEESESPLSSFTKRERNDNK